MSLSEADLLVLLVPLRAALTGAAVAGLPPVPLPLEGTTALVKGALPSPARYAGDAPPYGHRLVSGVDRGCTIGFSLI